VTYFIIII